MSLRYHVMKIRTLAIDLENTAHYLAYVELTNEVRSFYYETKKTCESFNETTLKDDSLFDISVDTYISNSWNKLIEHEKKLLSLEGKILLIIGNTKKYHFPGNFFSIDNLDRIYVSRTRDVIRELYLMHNGKII